jgi:ABC-type uncharacterized transport system ATPase subunit
METDDALWARLAAICCSEWGMPPAVFDEEAEAGRIAAEAVLEAVTLRAMKDGNVIGYLFRERAAERRRKVEVLKVLALRMQGLKGAEERAALQQRMNDLSAELRPRRR